MASGAGDKTEKATPRRRDEARKEGQVARSMEVGSAFAMLAGFGVLVTWGGSLLNGLASEMHYWMSKTVQHDVSQASAGEMFRHVVATTGLALAPFFAAMAFVAVFSNVIQVGLKITPSALKPKFSRINPLQGFKQKFSITSLVELFKNVAKLVIVGAPATMTLWTHRFDLLALADVPPAAAGLLAVKMITTIGLQVAGIYMVVAIGDYLWQRRQFEKGIRMSKQEVRTEAKQQDVAPEIKAAQRRRQRDASRRRMLQDVGNADVIITNPTHYAVALKYDAETGTPTVVAKGVDLLALRIRELAEDAKVMRVENRPLARELYARVEVGHMIPGDLFAAVAEVLAYVYRMEQRQPGASESDRRRAAA